MNNNPYVPCSASPDSPEESSSASLLTAEAITALRAVARRAIEQGQIPCVRAEHTWGGSGSNSVCAVCQKILRRDEPEIELEFGSDCDARYIHLHVHCWTAWELECPITRDELPGTDPAGAKAKNLPEGTKDGTIRARERDFARERGPSE